MLCLSWQMGSLPNDPERLAMLIGVKPADFIRAWRQPLTKCWRKTRKGLVNDRLERERAWAESRQQKARESARHRVYRTSDDASALRSQSARNANGSAQIALLSRSRSRSRSKDKKEEKRKRDAPTAPPSSPAVYWNPVPVWKKNDASHKSAVLRVDGEHLTQLIDDYPSVDVPGEIVNLKHHALNNPGWAKAKRDWRKTLGNWLKREARGNQSQSAAAAEVAWEQEQGQAPDNTAAIAACEKELGPHAGRLTKRERYSFCAEGCGYREPR